MSLEHWVPATPIATQCPQAGGTTLAVAMHTTAVVALGYAAAALQPGWVNRCQPNPSFQTGNFPHQTISWGCDALLSDGKKEMENYWLGGEDKALGRVAGRPPPAQGTVWLCAEVLEESRDATRWHQQRSCSVGAPCTQASI